MLISSLEKILHTFSYQARYSRLSQIVFVTWLEMQSRAF
jgi:hypothetical protein